jgi:hypothetical protein
VTTNVSNSDSVYRHHSCGRPHFGAARMIQVHAPNLRTDGLAWSSISDMPRWVDWRREVRDGKITKLPYVPFGSKMLASANDPLTWGTREQASEHGPSIAADGIGVQLGQIDDEWSLGGIDFDSCIDPISRQIAPWAADIIRRLKSYTEVSPSGTGLKLYFLYSNTYLTALHKVMGGAKHGKQFKPASEDEHGPSIEIYISNRYFAVTNDAVVGCPTEIHKVFLDDLIYLIRVAGPAFVGKEPAAPLLDKPNKTDSKPAATAQIVGLPSDLWDRINHSALWNPTLRRLLSGDLSTMTDRSRSSCAMALGGALARAGYPIEEMAQALRTWPVTAEWAKEKAETDGGRQYRRIWEKANAPMEADGPTSEEYIDPQTGEIIQVAKAGPAKSGIKLYTIAELRSLPQPKWLIKGLIPERSLVIPYGPPKKGKTFLVISQSMHVAAGAEWCGRAVEQGIVVYIAGEGVGGMPDRIAAMQAHHGFPDEIPFYVVTRAINFSLPSAVNELIEAVRSQVGEQSVAMVVVDTLARAMPGVDENSSQEIGLVIAACDRVKETLNCTVVPIHHSGKEVTKGLRGSSAIQGAVDASFSIDCDDKILRAGSRVTMTPTDQKEADPGPPMSFLMTEVATGIGRSSLVPVLIDGDTGGGLLSPSSRLTTQESLAMRALTTALIDHRAFVTGNANVPGNVPACTDENWREAFRKLKAGESWESARKTFKRVSESLINKNFVGCSTPYVWKVTDDDDMH